MPNFEANFFFMSLTVTLSVCICRKYLQLSALIPKISVLSASSQNVSIMGLYDGREKGGTVETIRLAHTMKRELKEIPIGAIYIPQNIRRSNY